MLCEFSAWQHVTAVQLRQTHLFLAEQSYQGVYHFDTRISEAYGRRGLGPCRCVLEQNLQNSIQLACLVLYVCRHDVILDLQAML